MCILPPGLFSAADKGMEVVDIDEYMQMSLSLVGKDQKMILSCTGSGIRLWYLLVNMKMIFVNSQHANELVSKVLNLIKVKSRLSR